MYQKKQSPKGSLTPQAIFKLDLTLPSNQKSNRTRYPSGPSQNIDLSNFPMMTERKAEIFPVNPVVSGGKIIYPISDFK